MWPLYSASSADGRASPAAPQGWRRGGATAGGVPGVRARRGRGSRRATRRRPRWGTAAAGGEGSRLASRRRKRGAAALLPINNQGHHTPSLSPPTAHLEDRGDDVVRHGSRQAPRDAPDALGRRPAHDGRPVAQARQQQVENVLQRSGHVALVASVVAASRGRGCCCGGCSCGGGRHYDLGGCEVVQEGPLPALVPARTQTAEHELRQLGPHVMPQERTEAPQRCRIASSPPLSTPRG